MKKRPLPWRTVVSSRDAGRFTAEQLDRAVLSVMQRAERTPGGAMIIREKRVPFGSAPSPAAHPEADAATGTAGAGNTGAQTGGGAKGGRAGRKRAADER